MPKRRRMSLRLAVAGGTALAGCSMMNPYVGAPLEERDLRPTGLRLAGGAGEGLALAESVRAHYYSNLVSTSVIRNGTAVAAVALSGWALYNALKPDGASTGATPGDTRRSVRLGVALASLYGLRQFFVNPGQEAIYADGYRSLTCLMLQSSPLLMTEEDKDPAYRGDTPQPRYPSEWSQVLPLRFAEAPRGDLDRLRESLDRLEDRILFLNAETAKIDANSRAIGVGDEATQSQAPLREQIKAARRALQFARHALADGRTLVRTIEGSGRDIKYRVGIIAAEINALSQEKQQTFSNPSDLLKSAHDITSSVLNIGVNTAADQGTLSLSGPTSFSPDREDGRRLADSTQRGGRLRVGFPIPYFAAAAIATAARAASPSASATGASPSSAASAAAATRKRPAAGGAKKAPTVPVAAKLDMATSGELQAIRDKIDDAIKNIATREAAAKQKAEQDKASAALAKQKEEIRALLDKLNAQAMACGKSGADVGGCGTHLAEQTEYLYAARRPVVHRLLAFRAVARSVAATPECAALAVLRVTPNDVVRARPGDTISYIMSERDQKSPLAVLQGPTDATTGAKFSVSPLMGTSLYVAKVELGSGMPEQTIQLVVGDSKGIASQTLPIVIGPALKPAPAASAAGSSASAPQASPAASGAASAVALKA